MRNIILALLLLALAVEAIPSSGAAQRTSKKGPARYPIVDRVVNATPIVIMGKGRHASINIANRVKRNELFKLANSVGFPLAKTKRDREICKRGRYWYTCYLVTLHYVNGSTEGLPGDLHGLYGRAMEDSSGAALSDLMDLDTPFEFHPDKNIQRTPLEKKSWSSQTLPTAEYGSRSPFLELDFWVWGRISGKRLVKGTLRVTYEDRIPAAMGTTVINVVAPSNYSGSVPVETSSVELVPNSNEKSILDDDMLPYRAAPSEFYLRKPLWLPVIDPDSGDEGATRLKAVCCRGVTVDSDGSWNFLKFPLRQPVPSSAFKLPGVPPPEQNFIPTAQNRTPSAANVNQSGVSTQLFFGQGRFEGFDINKRTNWNREVQFNYLLLRDPAEGGPMLPSGDGNNNEKDPNQVLSRLLRAPLLVSYNSIDLRPFNEDDDATSESGSKGTVAYDDAQSQLGPPMGSSLQHWLLGAETTGRSVLLFPHLVSDGTPLKPPGPDDDTVQLVPSADTVTFLGERGGEGKENVTRFTLRTQVSLEDLDLNDHTGQLFDSSSTQKTMAQGNFAEFLPGNPKGLIQERSLGSETRSRCQCPTSAFEMLLVGKTTVAAKSKGKSDLTAPSPVPQGSEGSFYALSPPWTIPCLGHPNVKVAEDVIYRVKATDQGFYHGLFHRPIEEGDIVLPQAVLWYQCLDFSLYDAELRNKVWIDKQTAADARGAGDDALASCTSPTDGVAKMLSIEVLVDGEEVCTFMLSAPSATELGQSPRRHVAHFHQYFTDELHPVQKATLTTKTHLTQPIPLFANYDKYLLYSHPREGFCSTKNDIAEQATMKELQAESATTQMTVKANGLSTVMTSFRNGLARYPTQQIVPPTLAGKPLVPSNLERHMTRESVAVQFPLPRPPCIDNLGDGSATPDDTFGTPTLASAVETSIFTMRQSFLSHYTSGIQPWNRFLFENATHAILYDIDNRVPFDRSKGEIRRPTPESSASQTVGATIEEGFALPMPEPMCPFKFGNLNPSCDEEAVNRSAWVHMRGRSSSTGTVTGTPTTWFYDLPFGSNVTLSFDMDMYYRAWLGRSPLAAKELGGVKGDRIAMKKLKGLVVVGPPSLGKVDELFVDWSGSSPAPRDPSGDDDDDEGPLLRRNAAMESPPFSFTVYAPPSSSNPKLVQFDRISIAAWDGGPTLSKPIIVQLRYVGSHFTPKHRDGRSPYLVLGLVLLVLVLLSGIFVLLRKPVVARLCGWRVADRVFGNLQPAMPNGLPPPQGVSYNKDGLVVGDADEGVTYHLPSDGDQKLSTSPAVNGTTLTQEDVDSRMGGFAMTAEVITKRVQTYFAGGGRGRRVPTTEGEDEAVPSDDEELDELEAGGCAPHPAVQKQDAVSARTTAAVPTSNKVAGQGNPILIPTSNKPLERSEKGAKKD